MTTPGKTSNVSIPRASRHEAYTLFEVLLALGIIAILLGLTVPLITNSWSNSPSEETAKAIEKSAQAAQKKAIETGEARQLRLTESGLVGDSDIPTAQLPKGWKMQVRRFTENRFRKPEKDEFWGFNGAGICDPLELRIFSKEESIVLKFDPLTALIVTDEK
jgi:type II secretory pathway pseudopilin PulG